MSTDLTIRRTLETNIHDPSGCTGRRRAALGAPAPLARAKNFKITLYAEIARGVLTAGIGGSAKPIHIQEIRKRKRG